MKYRLQLITIIFCTGIIAAQPSRHLAASMSDGEFVRMVSTMERQHLQDSLSVIFASRSAKGQFSMELLFSLYRNGKLVENKDLWGKIIDIWALASDMPVYALLAANSEYGKLPIADTLYRALDAAGRIEAHELLRYGRVKSLLGDYHAAAGIYCRVIIADKRVEHAALGQMGQLLADADSADKVSAIRSFRRCVFADPLIDTAYYRNWIADFYGKHGFFEREIATLVELDIPSAPSGRKLAEIAKAHFSRRRYRHAANGSVAAFEKLLEKDLRSNAAFVAYHSFMQLGIRDSALVWLKLSEVSNKDTRVQTVALNQETGYLERAAALIDSLPPSLSKDTLLVRQHLFSGEPQKALNEITASRSTAWGLNPSERHLWRGRCMIFGGRAHEASPVLDSILFAPAWHGASEVLRYRYWIQKLEDDYNALAAWGKLEHLVYIEDLTGAVKTFKGYKMAGEAGEMMAIRLCRILTGLSRYQEALEVLESVKGEGGGGGFAVINITAITGDGDGKNKDKRSPEYLYFMAEALSELGRVEEARATAQKILKDHPADIFAQKARILLMKI